LDDAQLESKGIQDEVFDRARGDAVALDIGS
jgi:hypothetical protein